MHTQPADELFSEWGEQDSSEEYIRGDMFCSGWKWFREMFDDYIRGASLRGWCLFMRAGEPTTASGSAIGASERSAFEYVGLYVSDLPSGATSSVRTMNI